MKKVAVLLGSTSDEEVMKGCTDYLTKFGIPWDLKILSAHRTPDATAAFVKSAEENGYALIIAAAGMAAHLPGVAAAYTTLPVIGVPLAGSELRGVDALYAIVQMPAGIPVATVAIGSAGAKNAAVLAAEILALGEPVLTTRLREFRAAGARF
ncbi:MAG: 5-(carboxyamino)imidazole ribonucleotide mutase [Ignavibacteriae bacterium]|nr:5-(carboxyamino)imidazole ribonucleotide mutase [Ignavibacteriota bacterium]